MRKRICGLLVLIWAVCLSPTWFAIAFGGSEPWQWWQIAIGGCAQWFTGLFAIMATVAGVVIDWESR